MPELGSFEENNKKFISEFKDERELLSRNYEELSTEEKILADKLAKQRDLEMGIDRTKNSDGETLH